MTDAFTAASGCKLLSNADGSVMEVVPIDAPTESSEKIDKLRRLQEITNCGCRDGKIALSECGWDVAEAAEKIRRLGTPVAKLVSGATKIADDLPVSYPGERRSSPSKYKSIEVSPAYEEDKTRPEHPMTARGKAMHKAVETGDDKDLIEDEFEWVQKCRDIRVKIVPANATVRREIRFPIIGADYGFVDELALLPNYGIVIDYKFGQNKQEDAETNSQVQAYALGILRTFPYLARVDVYLLYPKLDIVDMATFTRADVPRIAARLMAIKKAHDVATPATCRYNDSTCVYCKHLVSNGSTCPVAGEKLLPIAQRYAGSHSLALPVLDFTAVTKPEDWARLLEAAPVFEAVADSIKRHAKEFRITTGEEIPGYDLTTVSGKRTITNPILAHEIATTKFGVTNEAFLRAVKVSAADLCDLAKESAPRGQKGKRAQEMEDTLRDAGVLTVGSDYQKLSKSKS